MIYISPDQLSIEAAVQEWKRKAWLNNLFFFEVQIKQYAWNPLRKKYPYSELFWSVSSGIQTESGEILRISPY